MQAPQIPADESDRLASLRQTGLLDTPPENRFDRLTHLAAQLFNVPIALVSLVDADRQWFKSRQGLDACETGRDISFCGHTILGNQIFEVPDARLDPRFADNPLVVGPPDIRFYAGAPLAAPDGKNIGTLCLIDSRPRQLTEQERINLREIADIVMDEIGREALLEQGLALMAKKNANAIVITDAHGRIKWTNANFSVLTGYGPEALAGRAVEDVLSTHLEAPDDINALAQALQQTGSVKTELAFAPVQGQHEWLRMTVDPMVDDAGICTGYVIALEIITREKLDAEKLQESERQFRTLVNNIPGITYRCLMDEHWTMMYMSDQVDPLSGYPASDFINNAVRSYQSVIHPDDRQKTDQAVAAAVQCNEAWSVEYRIMHRDGTIRWAHERGSAVQDDSGHIQYLDGFILDITEEKRLRIESQRQIDAFAVLNEISSNATLSIPEQTYRALELGARFLGMDLGILGRIEGDFYRVRARKVVRGEAPARDHMYELSQTFCALAIHQDDLVAIHDVQHSPYAEHPARNSFDYASYIGIPVRLSGELYGTLSFYSVAPRSEPFSDSELMFMRLLSRWAAAAIERSHSDRAMERSEARLRGLFELSPIGIALNAYETGLFIESNPALLKLTGYQADELKLLSLRDLTPAQFAAQEQQQRKQLEETGQYGPYEKELLLKNGTCCPVLLNGVVVYDINGRKLIWSIIEDISERKRIDRMKNEFISTISHELRTPLTAISGALGLVAGGVAGTLPDAAQHMISIAHKNSQRLGFMINDLLDMEKLIAGKMQFDMRKHLLESLLEQALQTNQPYADQFKVQLVLLPMAERWVVNVDAQRFAQVMANLLSNAAKFSPEASRVEVSATCSDDLIRINVRDYGPGIPQAFRERIFQKFAQADGSDSRQKGGTGLGLAITRELIEHMKGRVGFDSVEGQGTTFWLELPVG
ncbi:MAG: PAS domain S-box protein [Gammaproteobacteria bacterium]